MKNFLKQFQLVLVCTIIVAALLFSIGYVFSVQTSTNTKIELPAQNTDTLTTLIVSNSSPDTILCWLTLNVNGSSWVSDVNGIFGITSTKKTQGSIKIAPGDSVYYESSIPFSGNISFINSPLNCPFPAPTLYEFCLNNNGTISAAQETVDISCVYGVTTIGKIELTSGGIWNSIGTDTVKTIQNKPLYQNTGIKGVYPYGCTTCNGRSGMVICGDRKRYERPNSKDICNVQRPAATSGGNVKITFLKQLK